MQWTGTFEQFLKRAIYKELGQNQAICPLKQLLATHDGRRLRGTMLPTGHNKLELSLKNVCSVFDKTLFMDLL